MKTVTTTGRFAIETERDFDDLLSDLSELTKGGDGHEAITSPQLLASYLGTMTEGLIEEFEKSIEVNASPFSYFSQSLQTFVKVDGYLAPGMKEQVAQSMDNIFEAYQKKNQSE